MVQVTVVGNVKADLIFDLPKHFLGRRLTETTINLPFGSKIEASDYQILPGGGGGNVAVGLQRLGIASHLITGIANDALGVYLRELIEKEGVRLAVEGAVPKQTAIAAVLRIGAERTIINHHPALVGYLEAELPESGWLHLGAVPSAQAQFLERFLSHVVKTGQKFSINPSLEMIENRDRQLIILLRSCEILFVNWEEGLRLAQLPLTSEPLDVVRALRRLGPIVVCLTLAERGAIVASDQEVFQASAIHSGAAQIDATGAGDAFASGFLAAYLQTGIEKEVRVGTALRWGIINSTAVLGEVGAQAGLLKQTQLERQLDSVKLKVLPK